MFCAIPSPTATAPSPSAHHTQSVTPLRCPTEMQFYTPSSTNLFVRYLPREVDDNRLREIFSVYGVITSSMVMRDIHNGQSLGTAFVRFSKHQEALQALCEAHGMALFGKCISVQWAKQQHDVTPTGQDRLKMNKLFIRNVPLDIAESALVDLVNACGTVKKVTLHNDTAPIMNVNERRRIVFITFTEEGAAEAALRAVHNTCPFPQCHNVPLMCKLINDAIKSKKHRARAEMSASGSAAASPTTTMASGDFADAAVPAATVSARLAEKTSALRRLSIASLNTCVSSQFVSGTDESPSTTPSWSFGPSQWEATPTSATPVAAFCGSVPRPVGAQSSSNSSQHGSTGEASKSSRFSHNPYSMGGDKMFA